MRASRRAYSAVREVLPPDRLGVAVVLVNVVGAALSLVNADWLLAVLQFVVALLFCIVGHKERTIAELQSSVRFHKACVDWLWRDRLAQSGVARRG